MTRCDALGRTVELLIFEDDGHEIDKRENRAVLVKAMCEWLIAAFGRFPIRNRIVAARGLPKLSAG